MKHTSLLLPAAALVAAFAPRSALAQPATGPTLPAETVKPSTATTGTTDIATSGFATSERPDEEDPSQATEGSLSAGGLFSAGNARTLALTSAAKIRIRRDEHQLTGQAAGNFARAGKKGEPIETTVENSQGLLRYDYFFTDAVAGFFQTTARRDRFQGLDLRLNLAPGAAYYFIDKKTQRLRGELGYDLQHDIRRDASRVIENEPDDSGVTPPPTVLDKTQTLHNVRAFLGYEGDLATGVSFVTSFEYLQNVSDLGTYRLIFDLGMKTTLADRFAIATTYTMRFENKPLPNVEQTDSVASVSLVYTLF